MIRVFKKRFLLLPFILAVPLTGGLTGPSCSVEKADGGVYKTVDGTDSWKQTIAIEDSKDNLSKANIDRLIADPNNSEVVFLLSRDNGIYVSNHFGESWKRILPESSKVYTLEADPKTPGRFYATALINGRGKILRTDNGGIDWREVFTEAGKDTFVEHIKIDATNKNSLLAINSAGLLIRSFDSGETWQAVYPFNEPVVSVNFDLKQENSIWILTNKGLWFSENGGSGFGFIDLSLEKKLGSNFYFIRCIGDNLYLSSDQGFFKTNDRGKTWDKIITLNNPTTFPVRALAVFSGGEEGKKMAIGAGMTMYVTEDGGKTWKSIQFEVDRQVNSIIIKGDDPKQILVGVSTVSQTGFGF